MRVTRRPRRATALGGAWLALAMRAALAEPTPLSLDVDVANQTGQPIACQALGGRWYSFDLGGAAPGVTLGFRVSIDPASLTVSMVNRVRVPVPIRLLYCGYQGRAWETRAVLPLQTLAQAAGHAPLLRLTCRRGAGAPFCY